MSVTICEVGPRDGLQNLPRLFSVQERAHLIAELAAAGLRQIEAVSMVNPARVPQMADAEAVLDALPPLPAVQLSALVLNRRGAERALATGVRELRFAVVASDTFCRRNQNMGSDDSLAAFAAVAPMVCQAGRQLTGVIATAYGCPFEGDRAARISQMAEALRTAGADRIVLADTIGVAAPRDIARVHDACRDALDGIAWGVHLHNTRNTGYANLMTALERWRRHHRCVHRGLGGCPFAPARHRQHRDRGRALPAAPRGIDTGLDHDRLALLVGGMAERVPGQDHRPAGRAGWFGA